MNIGRTPQPPNQPRTLNITLQVGNNLAHRIMDSLLVQQRQGAPLKLTALAGKDSQKPNILPHNVRFVAPQVAARDYTTHAFILTGGTLAEQFHLASAALQSGKHVFITDSRLLAAYGDILGPMAHAYHTSLSVAATLGENLALAPTLNSLSPLGITEVLHHPHHPLNVHISAQEDAPNILDIPETEIMAAHPVENTAAIMALAFNNWQRQPQLRAQPVIPAAHVVRTAQRLGGVLRYCVRTTPTGAHAGLHFMPQQHPAAFIPGVSAITTALGTTHTLSAQNLGGRAITVAQPDVAHALTLDVLALAHQPRRTTPHPCAQRCDATAPQTSLLFTNTAAWRQAKLSLNAHVQQEQLIGTTLAVTLTHSQNLVFDASMGTVCQLPATATMATQTPHLSLAV